MWLLKPEYGCAVSWKRIFKGVGLAVALALFRSVGSAFFIFTVQSVFIVQKKRVKALLGNPDAVVVAGDGREIADEEKVLLLSFIAADEAEDASVSVVGIDPFKPPVISVKAVERRIGAVEGKEAADIILQIRMERFIHQMPV